jgi:hypothetical protein
MSILLNKTIRLFLDSIGRRDEYEYYLEKFRADHSGTFALICPLPDGFETAASVFTFDLSFLLRLELDPVILLCGPHAMQMRKLLFSGDHPFSAHLIETAGNHVRNHSDDILRLLDDCRQKSKILVIIDPASSLETALTRIVPTVSNRIHFVRTRGPLHTTNGKPLYYYHTRATAQPQLAEADRPIAHTATHLLQCNPRIHISISSPLQLLQELFTVKGAGCVIRTGSEIHHYSSWHLIEPQKLINLLENSFQKKLVNNNFFNRLTDIYLEKNYNGAALLEPHSNAMYLSKFTVEKAMRGEGLALELWQHVTNQHSAVFWRSRRHNTINHWYEKLSDGHHSTDQWKIFWHGVNIDSIPELINFALNQPDDFAPTTTQ